MNATMAARRQKDTHAAWHQSVMQTRRGQRRCALRTGAAVGRLRVAGERPPALCLGALLNGPGRGRMTRQRDELAPPMWAQTGAALPKRVRACVCFASRLEDGEERADGQQHHRGGDGRRGGGGLVQNGACGHAVTHILHRVSGDDGDEGACGGTKRRGTGARRGAADVQHAGAACVERSARRRSQKAARRHVRGRATSACERRHTAAAQLSARCRHEAQHGDAAVHRLRRGAGEGHRLCAQRQRRSGVSGATRVPVPPSVAREGAPRKCDPARAWARASKADRHGARRHGLRLHGVHHLRREQRRRGRERRVSARGRCKPQTLDV